jgi:D-sedoheptulose 7-phosphate isomerase
MVENRDIVGDYFKEAQAIINKAVLDDMFKDSVYYLCEQALCAIRAGGTLFFCGNGGSAADAMHLAAELTGFFNNRKRMPYRSMALCSNVAYLTAVSNDSRYHDAMVREARAFVRPLDMVIGLSTSGKSENVIQTLKVTKGFGATTGLITGRVRIDLLPVEVVDHCVRIPSTVTSHVQEVTMMIGHMLCKFIETNMEN